MAFQTMMSSTFGGNSYEMTPSTYTTYPVMDDYSSSRQQQQQMYSDSCRRTSRSHNGQRPSGAMRVVKPSSASTSPNSMLARRRMMMGDNTTAQKRQQALNQAILQQMQDTSSYFLGHQEQSDRAVSWHQSSPVSEAQQMHSQMAPIDYSHYAMATPTTYHTTDYFAAYQNLPPTPIAYSGQTSPVSGFSPVLASYMTPVTQTNVMPAYVADSWVPSTQSVSSYADAAELCPAYTNQEAYDWQTYSPHTMEACTAPPTPDEFQVSQQPQTMQPEESIPYQSLDESSSGEDEEEEEGEILIGMGLYDLPSKGDTDPELDYYRTTTSHLLNTTYRHGKGWKLEESWEPPASDDEDNEDDADGDEEEEEEEEDDDEEEK